MGNIYIIIYFIIYLFFSVVSPQIYICTDSLLTEFAAS